MGVSVIRRLDSGEASIYVQVVLEYTQPGKPTQNAFVERFNGIYRDGVLDAWCFMNLSQVREETERWLKEHNPFRPDESLGLSFRSDF